jgi:hypothetical protein
VHKAKNLVPAGAGQKPTATGEAVFGLQQATPYATLVYLRASPIPHPIPNLDPSQAMPYAKLVYVSATGASSVRGLAPNPNPNPNPHPHPNPDEPEPGPEPGPEPEPEPYPQPLPYP